MNQFIIICIITIFILIILYYLNKSTIIENLYFQTWTPYYIDHYYQPSGSYFFYYNGYMHPM